MDHVAILPANGIGRHFIPKEHLPDGKDEYCHRDAQALWPKNRWRHLEPDEIQRLRENNNRCGDWNDLWVTDPFDAGKIENTSFFGLVRIGTVREVILEHRGVQVPAGITDSVVIACDIGDDSAIHHVRYLAHYIIGDRSLLLNIDEMHTTNRAKFGNGIIKDGESEDARVWLNLANETGSRRVLPFDGMLPADATLWTRYRDDAVMQENLKSITQTGFDSRLGFYGTVGNQCVIKNSRILKDVKVGSHCTISGVNKLKNLTVHSSEAEPTRIGEGAEMVDGIVGYGCRISFGCKAVRFVLGDHSNLKLGARLIHTFLGDNSTISCCEVLNNLIFPAHEQHHNNSFLIASVIMGQSNIAAGATLGSNHNSRANDCEITAGRGFWPGLCTSLKYSCRFASFVLLSKTDYPAEMNIPLPFSLVGNNPADDRLEILPAYWWLYNMYALVRNSLKVQDRDKRKNRTQHIEFDALAPDTVEEILEARRLLEIWVAKADLRGKRASPDRKDEKDLGRIGRNLLSGSKGIMDRLEILGEDMEKSDRKVLILKAPKAYQAYEDMLYYYSVKNILDYWKTDRKQPFASVCDALKGERVRGWLNLGGQLVSEKDVDQIRADIRSGKLDSWEKIHKRYDALWAKYPLEKQKHAFAVLGELHGKAELTKKDWLADLDRTARIQEFLCDQVVLTRQKDFENPFRLSTYRNQNEMTAALGTLEDDGFIKCVRDETETFKNWVEEIKTRSQKP